MKRVSPAMIHTYFDYITTEYPRGSTDHGMLLVQLHGDGRGSRGRRWRRGGCWRVPASAPGWVLCSPHAFRHSFTSAVLDASGGNLVIARDAGGWASAAMVDEVYGHVDVHDPDFDAALRTGVGCGPVSAAPRRPTPGCPCCIGGRTRSYGSGSAGDPHRPDRRAFVRSDLSTRRGRDPLPEHPIYRWECVVDVVSAPGRVGRTCARSICGSGRVSASAVSGRPTFLSAATGLERHVRARGIACRVCPQRPVAHTELRLCQRHGPMAPPSRRPRARPPTWPRGWRAAAPARLRVLSGGGLHQPGRLAAGVVPVAYRPLLA